MYCDNEPPKEKNKGDFPTFEYSSVSVDQCWYYLSLLERFVDTTKNMAEDDLKMYLVRAEYRYFQFISTKITRRKISSSTPPLDIAFFWQAHMLSPIRFYEDTLRTPPFYHEKVPLKAIHQAYNNHTKAINMDEWKKVMGDEPYDLTIETIRDKNSYACVTCIVCFSRIQLSWDEYTEWRTDHSTALSCYCCDAMFTVKHVGKANLFADIFRKNNNVSGLKLDSKGKIKDSITEHQLLSPVKDIKSLPFNRGLKPLDDYIRKNQPKPITAFGTETRKKVIAAIQSTYLCTPYQGSSFDLIHAVARQYKFAFKVTKEVNWNASDGIIRGIRNYSKFLAIIKETPKLQAVPTIEIDLAWHTHMLHHNKYRSFCLKHIGKMVNHDDTIPEKELAAYVTKTDQAWKARDKKRKDAICEDLMNKYLLVEQDLMNKYLLVEQALINKDNEHVMETKEKGLKSKFKHLFSLKDKKKKGDCEIQFETQTSSTPDNSLAKTKNHSKKGYIPEFKVFENSYFEGNYNKSTLDYNHSANRCEEKKEDQSNTYASLEKPPEYSEKDMVDYDNNYDDDCSYDKQEISYHDKKSIGSFIKLNNNNQLLDLLLDQINETSKGYGFIGTSTCANTDYLDQWEHLQENDDKDLSTSENSKDHYIENDDIPSTTSKYTKVFSTEKSTFMINLNDDLKLPMLPNIEESKVNRTIKSNNHFSSFSKKVEETRYRNKTSSPDFNWQLVSATWYEANNISSCDYSVDSLCGGWSNCAGENNIAICAGITNACEPKDPSYSGGTTVINSQGSSSDHRNSHDITSSNEVSNCGGGISSCGTGTSSCSGGTSNCGGSADF